jgi:hypothetical protein
MTFRDLHLLFDVFLIVPLLFFQSTDCFADKLLCQTIKNFLVTSE